MLKATSAEHAKGRLLYIVTTNLDTQRTVIWDMGRIASIGSPQALRLFRDVIVASASIPVVSPPVLIIAQAHGRTFQEMHVDGAVTAPILTLPEDFLLQKAESANGLRINIYTIVNSKIERDFYLVPHNLMEIAARSSVSITKMQTRSIVHGTFHFARHNDFGFNLTYIDMNISPPSRFGFDTN